MTEAAVETTETPDIDIDDAESFAGESFTSETKESSTPREIVVAPASATGRRKEAIARVRVIPGTGRWTVNGRTLEDYFPNKVHQQLVNEPFRVLEADGRFDVIARISGGGVVRPGRCAAAGRRPGAERDRRRGQPADAEEGRLPHP